MLSYQNSVAPPDGASHVIMLRTVPMDVTEEELQAWGQGVVYEPRSSAGQRVGAPRHAEVVGVQIQRSRGGNRAFVQFEDLWAARAVMQQFVYNAPSIALTRRRGGQPDFPLNLVYSDKTALRPAPQRRDPRAGFVDTSLAGNVLNLPPRGHPSAQMPSLMDSDEGSRLLLVVLKNLMHTVRLDLLFWVFTQFAKVDKMSAFAKDGKNQIIVQFADVRGAELAMSYLDGKTLKDPAMGEDLCQLAIVPSRLGALTFRNEDQRNRDYETHNVAIERLLVPHLLRTNLSPEAALDFWNSVAQHLHCPFVPDFIWGSHVKGDGWLIPEQEGTSLGRIPTQPELGKVGHCMHIAGLPDEEQMSAAHLFRLVGCFGHVRAVRLLFKHKGCALVQFETNDDCEVARTALHGVAFQGRNFDAKKSTQRNATHWNGSSATLQQRMCSILDDGIEAPRFERGVRTRPSKFVTFWGLSALEQHSIALLQQVSGLTQMSRVPSLRQKGDQWSITLQCGSLNDAVRMVADYNGNTQTQSTGLPMLWHDGVPRVRFATESEKSGVGNPPAAITPVPVRAMDPQVDDDGGDEPPLLPADDSLDLTQKSVGSIPLATTPMAHISASPSHASIPPVATTPVAQVTSPSQEEEEVRRPRKGRPPPLQKVKTTMDDKYLTMPSGHVPTPDAFCRPRPVTPN